MGPKPASLEGCPAWASQRGLQVGDAEQHALRHLELLGGRGERLLPVGGLLGVSGADTA
ncbi:hypothetical protein [Nonomuraea rubra]|uniref:hypothetical protein n=1 Tax=Nonomuraea rubra TaxID=46180 RepID=UPI0031EF8BBE